MTETQQKKPAAENKPRKVAFASHPLIEAVVKQLYRFSDTNQAVRRLDQLRRQFEISSEQETADGTELKLWIKGFAISDEEQKQGYLGHYARVRPRKVAEGHIILLAEKDEVPLLQHPQRQRPRQKHPNWGHPILRAVKKKTIYPNLMEAQSELERLHREYPDTSIPNLNKLHILVYAKDPSGQGNPTRKVTLAIQHTPDGGYFIFAQQHKARPINRKKRRPPVTLSAALTGMELPEGVQAIQGRFTALVEMKRKKRA